MDNNNKGNIEDFRTITDGLEGRLDSDVGHDVRLGVLEALYEAKRQWRRDLLEGKLDSVTTCGALLIVGYHDRFAKYTIPMQRDIVPEYANGNPERRNIRTAAGSDLLKRLTTRSDGAVLMDKDGYIVGSGYMINNFDVEKVADRMGLPTEAHDNGHSRRLTLSERYGFCEDVGTRHCRAKAASQKMPGTIVYTMSETSAPAKIRAFYKGKHIASPFKEELGYRKDKDKDCSSVASNVPGQEGLPRVY